MSNANSQDLNEYVDYLTEIGEPLTVEEECYEHLDFLVNVYPESKEKILEKLKEIISNESTKND